MKLTEGAKLQQENTLLTIERKRYEVYSATFLKTH